MSGDGGHGGDGGGGNGGTGEVAAPAALTDPAVPTGSTGPTAPASPVAPGTPATQDSRGIVQPAAGLRAFTLDRFAPSPGVARLVDRYWLVSWNLPPGRAYRSQVLVHPVVNIVFDEGLATVSGVDTGRFSKTLTGSGRALGIMFRPGGFHCFLGASLATLTDRSIPLAEVSALAGLEELVWPLFHADPESGPESGAKPGAEPESDPDPKPGANSGTHPSAKPPGTDLATAVDAHLAARTPADPQPSEQTIAWADLAVHDRALTRVEDLAAAAGVGIRTLQRAFTEHIGIGPKWFFRRYRIYEAAERVAHQERVDWSALAADLGYSDQAHLTRDFTAAIGQPPAQYAAAARRSQGQQGQG